MADWPDVVLFRHVGKTRPKSIAQKHVEPDGERFETYVSLSKVRERIESDDFAEALWKRWNPGRDDWETIDLETKESFREDARAALAASFPKEDS